jgi:hypothetical protein
MESNEKKRSIFISCKVAIKHSTTDDFYRLLKDLVDYSELEIFQSD